MFKQTEQFVKKFDADESVDEHIQEKTLLLLGFLYPPADRIAKEMKREIAELKDPLEFPEKHRRLEAFSTEVYVPLMELLSKRVGAYVSRHGKEKLDKLFIDNDLTDLLQHLE
ncbi:MAG: hypothetical protein HY801_15855 [Candidatus Lindowbacteria bacterium]|nr:hypothetical protein [Candidatus Lindowbacteria bacterium]